MPGPADNPRRQPPAGGEPTTAPRPGCAGEGPGGAAPFDLDALAGAVAEKLAERLTGLAQKRYLTVAHAAEYADLSEDSIRTLISGGKLTGLRPVPGRVLVDRRELDALLASSTRRPRRGRGVYERGADAG